MVATAPRDRSRGLTPGPGPPVQVLRSDPRTRRRRSVASSSRRRRLVVGVEQLCFELVLFGLVVFLLVATLLERHRKPVDAGALDLEDVETHAVVRDVVA